MEAQPERVLQTRTVEYSAMEELLVKWKGLLSYDCTWEDKSRFQRLYPNFDLEDKVNFGRPSIVTYEDHHPPIIHQYQRRKSAARKMLGNGSSWAGRS